MKAIGRAALAVLLSLSASGGELEDARRTVEKWRPVFYMKDWTLHVHIVSADDLARICEHCVAASLFEPGARRGEIFILRRKDYTAELRRRLEISDVKADQRNSVVHEMLHCVIQHMEQEIAVQVIAAALHP